MPPESNYPSSFIFKANEPAQTMIDEAGAPLSAGLKGLARQTGAILERLEGADDDTLPLTALQELRAAVSEIAELQADLSLTLAGADPDRVFWVELPPEESRPVRIKSAPLEVSQRLKEGLWDRLDSAVLTSATLATGSQPGGFDHLKRRLGLAELPEARMQTEAFGSPFDFPKQRRVCYPSFLTPPNESMDEHCRQVAAICASFASKLRRNMLLLFTSYDAMRRVERELKALLIGTPVELLVQDGSGGRERLVRRFRKSAGALLLGTDALWEGIDVPGEALEIVVIPRLPFDVPNDPVVSARIERIRQSGGNPFAEYQIPSAVLKLRQGAGRLIRTASDRGVVLVLDPRAATKGYGYQFRRAVPGDILIPKTEVELERAVTEFFG
jgi:ATP-dependent DNA helicase DinG